MVAISIKNLERFFKKHPEYIIFKDRVIEKFKDVCNSGGIINGIDNVEYIMGDLIEVLRKDFLEDPEHFKICMNEYTKPKKDKEE